MKSVAEIAGGYNECLEHYAAATPHAPALCDDQISLTYGELAKAVYQVCKKLRNQGFNRSDRLAVTLPNTVDIVILFLAARRLGLVWVGVSKPLSSLEKHHILSDSGASLYIIDAADGRDVRSDEHICALVDILDLECEGSERWWNLASETPIQSERFDDLLSPAVIAYTSGTTGQPKGVVHNEQNMMLAVMASQAHDPNPDPQQRIKRSGGCFPFTVTSQMVFPLGEALIDGICTCMTEMRYAQGLADWVRDQKIERLYLAPTMIFDLVNTNDVTAADLTTIKEMFVGGSSFPSEHRERYRTKFNHDVMRVYGQQEGPPCITRERTDDIGETIGNGPNLPHIEIVICDNEGKTLAQGETGEICIRGAATGPLAGVYDFMLGYWKRPADTKEALRDGLLHSGDIGYLDIQGHLCVVDRLKDMIIRGGANIYAAEVERVIEAFPGIKGVAVVGRPHERLGEEVVAYVLHRIGAEQLDEPTLRCHCGERLAAYKVPAEFIFVDNLPRNALGKIVKKELREQLTLRSEIS